MVADTVGPCTCRHLMAPAPPFAEPGSRIVESAPWRRHRKHSVRPAIRSFSRVRRGVLRFRPEQAGPTLNWLALDEMTENTMPRYLLTALLLLPLLSPAAQSAAQSAATGTA